MREAAGRQVGLRAVARGTRVGWQARRVGSGTRGVTRGNKPAPMKLGAKKLNAKDIDLESMLN